MPVILLRADWADWLEGAPDAAGLLCRPYPEMVACEQTTESWVRPTMSGSITRAGRIFLSGESAPA